MSGYAAADTSATWLYEQALQLLLMMYREPSQVSAAQQLYAHPLPCCAGCVLQLMCMVLMMYREPTQVRAAGTAGAAGFVLVRMCVWHCWFASTSGFLSRFMCWC
jgi:hypothetical protein